MSKADNLLSISVLAPSRPRITLDLFRAVRERGCEIEDCRLAPAGALVGASLLISGSWAALGKLETALPNIAQKFDMQVQFARCGEREAAPDYRPYAVEVFAPQHADLIVHLLEFFAGQDVDVPEVMIQKYASQHTGASMCSVHMVVHVPVNQHPQALRESFMDLCDDLNADGLLDPIKT